MCVYVCVCLCVCVYLCVCVVCVVCVLCVCVWVGIFVIDKMTVESSISLANCFRTYM